MWTIEVKVDGKWHGYYTDIPTREHADKLLEDARNVRGHAEARLVPQEA